MKVLVGLGQTGKEVSIVARLTDDFSPGTPTDVLDADGQVVARCSSAEIAERVVREHGEVERLKKAKVMP